MMEWVRNIQEPGKPVIWVAHNGKTFDFPFFIRELDRCGHGIPDHWRFFDTLPLVRKLVDSNGISSLLFLFFPFFSVLCGSVGAWEGVVLLAVARMNCFVQS